MAYLNYKDLIVWQRAIELVEEVYRIVKLLPHEEKFALNEQMRRSAVSIASNIAEGEGRKSRKEFINFISIANGSRAELETQLIICERLGFLSQEQLSKSFNLCEEISKMLYTLSTNLKTKD